MPSIVQSLSPVQLRTFLSAKRHSDVAYPCEHGHLDCSTRMGGPCLDEALLALETPKPALSCPCCQSELTPEQIKSLWGTYCGSLGGRKKVSERCRCGAMTKARAQARGHKCTLNVARIEPA